MSRLRILIVLLGIWLLLTQCGKEAAELPPQLATLLGTWRLVAPDSTQNVTLTLALDTANPPHDITPLKASGRTALNEYSVRMYAAIDGKISADDITATATIGSLNALQFEREYLTRLRNVVRYEQPTPSQLRLYHGGTQAGVLVYRK